MATSLGSSIKCGQILMERCSKINLRQTLLMEMVS